MPYLHPYLKNPACFELAQLFTLSDHPLPPLPSNWERELSKLLNVATDQMTKHTRKTTYRGYPHLLKSLQFLFCLLSKRIEIPGLTLDASMQTMLTSKLVEDIEHCTEGYHNRVISVFGALSIPKTIPALLQQIRTNLVTKTALQYTDNVHGINRFLQVAHSAGYGIEAPNQHDNYANNVRCVAKERIDTIFYQCFRPFWLFTQLQEEIKGMLINSYGYRGCLKEEGYNVGEYEAFLNYLKELFPNPTAPSFTHEDLEWDETYTHIVDIKWQKLAQALWLHVKDKYYHFPTPLKEAFERLLNQEESTSLSEQTITDFITLFRQPGDLKDVNNALELMGLIKILAPYGNTVPALLKHAEIHTILIEAIALNLKSLEKFIDAIMDIRSTQFTSVATLYFHNQAELLEALLMLAKEDKGRTRPFFINLPANLVVPYLKSWLEEGLAKSDMQQVNLALEVLAKQDDKTRDKILKKKKQPPGLLGWFKKSTLLERLYRTPSAIVKLTNVIHGFKEDQTRITVYERLHEAIGTYAVEDHCLLSFHQLGAYVRFWKFAPEKIKNSIIQQKLNSLRIIEYAPASLYELVSSCERAAQLSFLAQLRAPTENQAAPSQRLLQRSLADSQLFSHFVTLMQQCATEQDMSQLAANLPLKDSFLYDCLCKWDLIALKHIIQFFLSCLPKQKQQQQISYVLNRHQSWEPKTIAQLPALLEVLSNDLLQFVLSYPLPNYPHNFFIFLLTNHPEHISFVIKISLKLCETHVADSSEMPCDNYFLDNVFLKFGEHEFKAWIHALSEAEMSNASKLFSLFSFGKKSSYFDFLVYSATTTADIKVLLHLLMHCSEDDKRFYLTTSFGKASLVKEILSTYRSELPLLNHLLGTMEPANATVLVDTLYPSMEVEMQTLADGHHASAEFYRFLSNEILCRIIHEVTTANTLNQTQTLALLTQLFAQRTTEEKQAVFDLYLKIHGKTLSTSVCAAPLSDLSLCVNDLIFSLPAKAWQTHFQDVRFALAQHLSRKRLVCLDSLWHYITSIAPDQARSLLTLPLIGRTSMFTYVFANIDDEQTMTQFLEVMHALPTETQTFVLDAYIAQSPDLLTCVLARTLPISPKVKALTLLNALLTPTQIEKLFLNNVETTLMFEQPLTLFKKQLLLLDQLPEHSRYHYLTKLSNVHCLMADKEQQQNLYLAKLHLQLHHLGKKIGELSLEAQQHPSVYSSLYGQLDEIYQAIRSEFLTFLTDESSLEQHKERFQAWHRQLTAPTLINACNEHRGLKKLLVNIAACILGLGIIYIAACSFNYLITNGRHFFFHPQTDSHHRLNALANTLDDLIPTPVALEI